MTTHKNDVRNPMRASRDLFEMRKTKEGEISPWEIPEWDISTIEKMRREGKRDTREWILSQKWLSDPIGLASTVLCC